MIKLRLILDILFPSFLLDFMYRIEATFISKRNFKDGIYKKY